MGEHAQQRGNISKPTLESNRGRTEWTRRNRQQHAMIVDVNETAFIQLISGRQQGLVPDLARFGLRCLAPFYAAATTLRNAGYQFRVSPAHRAEVPVISVGNITTGGTGKTPIVAMIVQSLIESGHRPCILSRGYRAIDDGGNDEKLVLDRLCPDVPHLQNPDRVASAIAAVSEHNASVIVLDDGFQHRRLGRDLDIVLIDATNPFGHEFVLPRGLLREPLSGLRRAGIVAITRCDQVGEEELTRIEKRLGRYQKPIVRIAFEPSSLVRTDGSTMSLNAIDGETVAAFCGIGNPDGFRATVASLGAEPVWFETYADHFDYDAFAIQRIQQLVEQHKVTRLVCTEKDLVKLTDIQLGAEPLAIRIAPAIRQGMEAFDSAVRDVAKS